jgi:predicted enzyme related to lactoylglutathione lyase
MKQNPVGWFEIYVDDLPRARKFYEAVFRTTFTKIDSKTPEMWQFASDMQSYGSPGALVHMPGFPAGNNSVIVYFSCEDCAVEEKRAVQAGGRVQKTKFAIGEYGFISLVFDSEGNIIGLHSLK